eukprot:scaffold6207_cov32-Tisochrysis_lutea.AAC.1
MCSGRPRPHSAATAWTRTKINPRARIVARPCRIILLSLCLSPLSLWPVDGAGSLSCHASHASSCLPRSFSPGRARYLGSHSTCPLGLLRRAPRLRCPDRSPLAAGHPPHEK